MELIEASPDFVLVLAKQTTVVESRRVFFAILSFWPISENKQGINLSPCGEVMNWISGSINNLGSLRSLLYVFAIY